MATTRLCSLTRDADLETRTVAMALGTPGTVWSTCLMGELRKTKGTGHISVTSLSHGISL